MTRRTRTSKSRNRAPEAQLTGAFNRLVAERPVAAAIVLVAMVVLAWFVMRVTGDASGSAAPGETPAAQSAAVSEPPAAPPSGQPAAPPSGQPTGSASGPAIDAASGLPYVAESALPPKAQQVLSAVRAGGPFEFDEDGGHFGNYEGILPDRWSGYYREYTVKLPTDRNRGAHRLVTGDGGEVYWTDDHYESFSVVKEGA